MATLFAGAFSAKADEASDFAQGFANVHVDTPDAAMLPSSTMTCETESGLVETHCWQSFTDSARSGQTDYVVIDVLVVDESFSIENQAQNVVLHVPETCEQASAAGTQNQPGQYSDAVCLASFGDRISVKTWVAPGTNANGIDVDHPADIERSDMLDEYAVEGVHEMLTEATKN